MSLFKPAEFVPAFLKGGFYGPPKSGKSYTALLLMLGLLQKTGTKKPLGIFDTEGGSDYLKDVCKLAGIELQVVRSRAFVDLVEAHREATTHFSGLIIDSVTHVWEELQKAFKRKHNVQDISLYDWGPIKAEWAVFTTEYLTSSLHVIVNGRAQDIWEETTNERGKKEKVVVGTKMATEKQLAYEPSLLVEMERVIDPKTGYLTPRAWILGDRFPMSGLSGKCFDFHPADERLSDKERIEQDLKRVTEVFSPHIERLNLGGDHQPVDTSRSSEGLFAPGSDSSRYEYQKKRDILIEEIKDEVDRRWSGMSVEQKNARIDVLQIVFGTSSKTAIENLAVDVLANGLKRIRSGEFDHFGNDHKANGTPPEAVKTGRKG